MASRRARRRVPRAAAVKSVRPHSCSLVSPRRPRPVAAATNRICRARAGPRKPVPARRPSLHGDMVAPADTGVDDGAGRARRAAAATSRRCSTCATPTAPRRTRATTTPARASVAQVRMQLRADAGRVPAPDPGVPRRVVRRLQHRLHADAADERQVLHRGDLLGRRRLVQGRRQGRGRRAVPVQGPERRRRLHVPGRPQRARDGGHHRAGAGAPASGSSTRPTRTTSCTRRSATTPPASSTTTARSPAIAATARRRTRTQMMKKALGEWAGGPKPSPFGCMEDTQDPFVRFLSPGSGAAKGHDFSVKRRRARRLRREEGRDPGDAAGVVGGGDGAALRVGSDRHQRRADHHRHRDRRQRPDRARHRSRDRAGVARGAGADEDAGAGCNVASGAFGAVGAGAVAGDAAAVQPATTAAAAAAA